MPKYGQFKYGKAKYGRYSITVPGNVQLQTTKYRLRTIDSSQRESASIVTQSAQITGSSGPVKVRLRTDSGDWVYAESVEVQGQLNKIRIKAVAPEGESSWVESVVGTVRKKG